MKREFKKKPKTGKGMPSAVVLSIVIHAALFMLAGMLVVFTVVKKEEKRFEPPKAVDRPKMKLKKPKVKVRKTAKPKPTTRIVTKMNRASMPDIQLPEMSGMGDGLADGIAGFDMMPDIEDVSVFGSGQSIGNDFEGTLYNLKRDRQGRSIPMDGDMFRVKLREFVLSGWNPSKLARYYQSPKKLYASHFMIPPIPAPMAPDVFGAPEMRSYYFMMVYRGKLVSTKPITFRFRANGDAYMMIRVDGKEVLLACWPFHEVYFDWWQSSSADNRKHYLGNQLAAVGDWITLEPGKPLDMDVMFGEWGGGIVAALLTVEVKGEEYEKNSQGGPILPAFKTTELSRAVIDKIQQYLPENEASLTNGPVFRDYDLPSSAVVSDASEDEPTPVEEVLPDADPDADKPRLWTLTDGRTFEAELVSVIGDKVVLKKSRGKLSKIPKGQMSEEDLEFIQLEMPPELDISFSKQSTQRIYPHSRGDRPIPTQYHFVFSATIKQTSTRDYDQELKVELFTMGAEYGGDKHILLDHQQGNFTLTKENQRSFRLESEPVAVLDYLVGTASTGGYQHRGQKYASYLVVITDSRGKIISHKTPKKWLFENLEKLREVSVGNFIDKTCTRVGPSRPKRFY